MPIFQDGETKAQISEVTSPRPAGPADPGVRLQSPARLGPWGPSQNSSAISKQRPMSWSIPEPPGCGDLSRPSKRQCQRQLRHMSSVLLLKISSPGAKKRPPDNAQSVIVTNVLPTFSGEPGRENSSRTVSLPPGEHGGTWALLIGQGRGRTCSPLASHRPPPPPQSQLTVSHPSPPVLCVSLLPGGVSCQF